ncbi:MAG TPA: N-acetylmuramoyl-L-alanine amidase [Puia sp.]|nr:N-acetylmuramoyl-L-alanine amidase [Puia sp.]
MLTTAIYLLKIILISGLLYSYYRTFLADRHFHVFNRCFLLGIPLLALALPFIHLPFGGYLWRTGQDIPSLLGSQHDGAKSSIENGGWQETDASGPGALSAITDWTMLAAIAYALITLVLFYLFLRQLRYIHLLTRSCPVEKVERMGQIRLFVTTEPGAPFSFLNRIFWNDQLDRNSALGRQVFRHELNHVRQGHSLDLLLLRPLTALCWINPFFHLIYREIKVIHEFLADNDAITEGDRYQYAEGLVWQTVRNPPSSLLHTFSGKTHSRTFIQSPIKRRITMITRTSRNSLFGRAMTLPLLLLLCCAFAARLQPHSHTRDTPLTVVVDAGHGGIDPGAINKDGVQEKDINLQLAEKIKQLGSQYNVRILLTRDKDELAGNKATKRESLEYRAQMANDNKADLFLSIHTDMQPSAYVKGFNVYVAENNAHYAQCVEFGSALTASLQKTYTTEVSLRKRKENIYVLHNTQMPAVLLSFGNMNNEENLSFIRKEDNQEKVARDVLEAIRTYGEAHPAHQ